MGKKIRREFLTTELGDFRFDAVITETITDKNTITDNPIEFGASVTDHTFANPRTFQMVGVVADNNFSENPTIENSLEMWENLRKLKNDGSLIDIQTGLELIKNVLIVSLSYTDDASTDGGLIISMELRQVFVVEAKSTEIPKDILQAGKTQKQATTKTNKGQVEKKPSSLLNSLIGGIL